MLKSLARRALRRLVLFATSDGGDSLAERFPQFEIGRCSYGGLNVIDYGGGTRVRVGAYCSIAAGVQVVLGGEHRTDWVTTFPFSEIDPHFAHIKGHPRTKGDINIGNDVWIGRDAFILSGVTIGDGAVVAARALVSRDVPPYGIVAGNPATLLRYRFPSDVIERLTKAAWWTWPTERVEAAVPSLLSTDVLAFLDAVESGNL
jgi:acetyltransferase-like isoleucine patch superfamily enzyme